MASGFKKKKKTQKTQSQRAKVLKSETLFCSCLMDGTKPQVACETLIPCILAQLLPSAPPWLCQLIQSRRLPQTKSWALLGSGSIWTRLFVPWPAGGEWGCCEHRLWRLSGLEGDWEKL